MKRALTAAVLSVALGTGAMAGNPAPAPVDPVVVAEPAPSSGWLVPLLALIFVVGASTN